MNGAASDFVAYTRVARLLHWTTAILVLTMIPLGLAIARFDAGPAQDFLYNLHRSTGVLILFLVTFRLYYRLTHKPLPLSPDIPLLQRFVAEATHWALYVLIILQALVGWIAVSAYPARFHFFGLFQLPMIWPENRALSEKLFTLHLYLGIAIGALAAAHIGAALFHHFVRKDNVLRRITG